MALHKIIRLATAATAGDGYLTFMGNEFGHPEWVDFPREGNQWSMHHARRLWSLQDAPDLRYRYLAAFDQAMLRWIAESGLVWRGRPRLLAMRENDRVLAFERSGWFLFLNLHPSHSYTDYELECLPGRYVHTLDTDEPAFGGFGRLQPRQIHEAEPRRVGDDRRYLLRLYLPARTALVLRREWP